MKRLLWILAALTATAIIGLTGFLVWAYRPVPGFDAYSYAPVRPDYWPTKGWKLSTPEAQGMRSEILLDMASIARDEAARDPEFYLDSNTVIRNRYIVAEFYPNENYPRGHLHVIHSATKSIISAVVGYRPNARLLTNLPARAFRPRVSASDRRHGLGPSATRMKRTSRAGTLCDLTPTSEGQDHENLPVRCRDCRHLLYHCDIVPFHRRILLQTNP